MSENPSSMNESSQAESGSLSDNGFLKIFGIGVFGWALGMVVLYGAAWLYSNPETAAIAALWMISHCWIAFLSGLLLMIVRGAMSKAGLAKPLVAYVLPVALLAALSWVSLAVYPDAALRSDLMTYLPVILVFYGAGWLWLALRGGPADGPALARAVLPSVLGGLIILGFIAVPAFASDAFRYRTAFQLTSDGIKIEDRSLVFDRILKITKPGNYVFSAPRYIWMEDEEEIGESGIEHGEIQWGASGAPKNGQQGSYPLRIVWKKVVLVDGNIEISPYEDYVVLEVRRPDEDDRLIYTISTDMEFSQ